MLWQLFPSYVYICKILGCPDVPTTLLGTKHGLEGALGRSNPSFGNPIAGSEAAKQFVARLSGSSEHQGSASLYFSIISHPELHLTCSQPRCSAQELIAAMAVSMRKAAVQCSARAQPSRAVVCKAQGAILLIGGVEMFAATPALLGGGSISLRL
jgi:hypothetical protein